MFILVNMSPPPLVDLCERITPRYATDWKVIGTLLGIPNEDLKAIEMGYPTNPRWCCNQMLVKWLEIDSTASWNKLFKAIQSPAVSSTHENGNYCCYAIISHMDRPYFSTMVLSSINTPPQKGFVTFHRLHWYRQLQTVNTFKR